MSFELPASMVDEYVSDKDQSGAPNGFIWMRLHKKDGSVGERALMPDFRISQEALNDILKIRIAAAHAMVRRGQLLFD